MDKDEEVYRNVCNMTSLNKCLKMNTTIVGMGFGVSELRSIMEAAQAHATPRKEKTTRWAENKPFFNILYIFLYRLTTFCGYRSLAVKSVRS